jgi:hypothetical protein
MLMYARDFLGCFCLFDIFVSKANFGIFYQGFLLCNFIISVLLIYSIYLIIEKVTYKYIIIVCMGSYIQVS